MRSLVFACVTALFASAAAFAQEPPPTRLVIDALGNVTTTQESAPAARTFATAAAAASATDFSMVPSVTSTPLHAVNSQRRFIYTCADANQQPLDCSIGISNRAVALSGGHQHQISPRPAGSLTATSGNTNFNTGFSTTYTAPEVSGTIELLVTLVFPPVPPATTGQTVSFTQTIGVEITGLETLPSGNWTPKGMVAGQHTDNHYGLPSMNASVLLLADDYRFEFGVPLEINDMSLVQGGLFDVFGPNAAREWHTDHKSHRWGDDVDVNLPPRSNRSSLLRSAGYVGLRRIVEPGRLTHYHFRLK